MGRDREGGRGVRGKQRRERSGVLERECGSPPLLPTTWEGRE